MAEFVDAVNQLEQLEEGGGDARTVLGPRVIGLTSPGGSEIGSDAEDSASSEILEGDEGGDDEDESSSSSSGEVEVLLPMDEVIARLTRQMTNLSLQRKAEARRATPSAVKLREYQIRIHNTSLEIIAAKAELNRLRALQGTRTTTTTTIPVVVARRQGTSNGNSVHRTPERDASAAIRLRDERNLALGGVRQNAAQEAARSAYLDRMIDDVANKVNRLGAEASDDAAAATFMRQQSDAMRRANARRAADLAEAQVREQDELEANAAEDETRARLAREERQLALDDAREQEAKNRRNGKQLAKANAAVERRAAEEARLAQNAAAELAKVRETEERRLAAAENVVVDVADAERAVERTETRVVVVIPTTARFETLRSAAKPDDIVLNNFAAFYQETFAANPAFSIERAPKGKKKGTFVFTVRKVDGATALLLVQLLFGGILKHWATKPGIGKEADGYNTLRTTLWTDTLIPLFTAVCLAASSNLLKEPGNQHLIAFTQGLKKSAAWLFTLALTGVTWHRENEPEGQFAQPEHFRKRTMFEALGVDNGAFARLLPDINQSTKNQLLTGDVELTGKTAINGVSTPLLKMAITLRYTARSLGIFNGKFHSIITQPNAAGEREVDWQALAAEPVVDTTENGAAIFTENTRAAPESMLSRIFMLPVFDALLGNSMRFFTDSRTSYESVGHSFDKKFYDTLSIVSEVFNRDNLPPYLSTASDTDPGRLYVSWKATSDDSGLNEAQMRALVETLRSAVPRGSTIVVSAEKQALTGRWDEMHFLATFAKELASSFQILTEETEATTATRLRALTVIVGVVMFTPLDLGDVTIAKSLFRRFGERPSVEVLENGVLVRQYVETAAKARQHNNNNNSSKSSQFRPAFLPQFAGGVSNKTLGALLESKAASNTTEFLRLAKEDGRVLDNLNDKDIGHKVTVLVPTNAALSAPAAQRLLTDAGAVYATIELHTLSEELDFEALSKSRSTRTVETALPGYNINLSVAKGFSNTKGGTINIGGALKLVGGSRKLTVVSGPMRAKNGVYYLVDGLIDATQATKDYGGDEMTKQSEFRPSWLPVALGGKSNKLLGTLIASSKQLTTKAFRTLLRDDPTIATLLNDADTGGELTVLVPSTDALRSPDALALLQDPDETRNAVEYHVFDVELDLERLSKSQESRTVTSEFAGIPFRFSVNRGFTNEAGGTLVLGNGVRQLGGGRTINVIGGPFRGKNGVYYVIDGVLDHFYAADAYRKLVEKRKQRTAELQGGTTNLGLTRAIEKTTRPLAPGELPPPFAATMSKSSRAKTVYMNARIASSTAKHRVAHRTAKLTPPPTKKDRVRMLNTRPGRGKFMLHSMARGASYLTTFDSRVDTLMDPSGAEYKDDPTLESVSDREQLIDWLRQRKEESRKTLPSSWKSRNKRGEYTNAKKKTTTTAASENVDDDGQEGGGGGGGNDDGEVTIYKRNDKEARNDMQHCFGPLLALLKATGVDAEIARIERPLAILAPEPSVLRALDLESMSLEQKKELLREHVLIAVWSANGGHDATRAGLSPMQLAELVHGETFNKPVQFETLNGHNFAHVVLVPASASERSIQNIDRKANVVMPRDIVSEKDVVYDDGVKRAHPTYVYMLDRVLVPNRTNVIDVHVPTIWSSTRAAKMSQGVLVPLENESKSDKKTNAREWLLQFENAARSMREERDAVKFIETLDRLEKHLDRIGGAVSVSPELERADIDKMFDKLDSAIAKNRNVDPMTKDDARQMLIDLQARFD